MSTDIDPPDSPTNSKSGESSITVGNVSNAAGVAVGHGAQAVNASGAQAPVIQTQGGFTGDVITAEQVTIIQQTERKPVATNRQAIPPPGFYVSRTEVEAKLRELLTTERGTVSVVGLHGLPGVGKTLVGRKIAVDLESEFLDGTLWADLEVMSAKDALAHFIEPFNPSFTPSPSHTSSQLLIQLQKVLGRKRVLIVLDQAKAESEVAELIPRNCPNIVVLLISAIRLPELFDDQHAVHLPEMTLDEAEQLFSNFWKNTIAHADKETLHKFAEQLNYVPAQMAVAARDVIKSQISPSDYVKELQQRKQVGSVVIAGHNAGFEMAYSNLPEHGKQVAPFLGVVGSGVWTLDALAAVTQLKRDVVETGLKQLLSIGLMSRISAGRFRISSSMRDFALGKLRELGGDALVRMSRALMTHYYLQLNQQTTRRHQMAMLGDFLSDDTRKQRFLEKLNHSFQLSEQSDDNPTRFLAKVDPNLSNLDLVEEVFERLVMRDPDYAPQWARVQSLQILADARQNLQVALGWALEQEDWALIRQFANVNSGGCAWNIVARNEVEPSAFSINAHFALVRDIVLHFVSMTSTMRAARISNMVVRDSECISIDWLAVRLETPVFRNVDMVGAKMLGLVVMNGVFTDVDMRGSDLRGSIFYNCVFTNVKFRNANFNGVEFINTVLTNTDFRETLFGFVNVQGDNSLTVRGRIVPGDLDMDMIGPYE